MSSGSFASENRGRDGNHRPRRRRPLGFSRLGAATAGERGLRRGGEAADGTSALTGARKLRPRLALVDVYLPDIDGFEVAMRLAGLDDAPAVVLISSHDRSELEPLVPGSGARGFVAKSELSREALEALLA
jgi:DNA-binding NarL/FixJ family response regulator